VWSITLKTAGVAMTNYETVRKQLFDMLEDLDGRLSHIADGSDTEDQTLPNFDDLWPDDNNIDVETNAARMERDRVQQAIARIDNGEYGFCELCGDTIDQERLKTLPHASMCVKCACQPGC
jgi:DnaK suppressor protein